MNIFFSSLRWLVALCFFVASDAFAYCFTAYQGVYSSTASASTNSGAGTVCKAIIDAASISRAPGSSYGAMGGTSAPGGNCYYYSQGGASVVFGTWNRVGTPDSTCAPQGPTPDQCLAGGPGIFSKTGSIISSNGNNYVLTQGGGSVCYGQCSHSLNTSPASCYSSGDGSGFCNYIGTPTGQLCSEPDAPLGRSGDPLNPPETPDVPPSDPNDPGCPPGYGWSGTTCAKNPPPDGGEPGGDTGGGDTGGGDTGGGGGGGGSGGGDTGGGDTGGGDTGGGDTGGGDTGGGDTGGGGTGGGGVGAGDGEGDGPDGSASSSSDCKRPPSCDGDVFLCAILNQSWSNRCAMLAEPTAADLKKIADQKAQAIADQQVIQQEFDSDVAGLMNQFNSGVSSGSRQGACLPDEQFTVMGKSFALPISKACPYLALLRYAVIAMAYLGAARILSRAI